MADRQVKITVDIVSGSGGSTKVKGTLREVDEEVRRINKSTQESAKQTQKVIGEATKSRIREELNEEKRKVREAKNLANQMIKDLDQINRKSSMAGGVFAGSFFGNITAQAAAKAISTIQSGAGAWLEYASNLEQARIGMTTMIGSAEQANQHLKALQEFAKSTPFEFGELVQASQKMQGVGIAAEKVIPLLKDVGNALAAAGRISELPNAIKALGDIQAKGKLAGQEIIQLANAGIPAIQMLSQHLNKTSAEILKMGEDGEITADILFAALHKMSSEKFGDAMEKQSKTFMGALSNIKDALLQTAETAFKPLYDRISRLAVDFANAIGKQGGDLEGIGRVIAQYMGKGIEAGTELTMKSLAVLISKRVEQVFSPGSGIFDPLSNAVMMGLLTGFARGFAQFPNELAKQPWYVRMLFGGTTGLAGGALGGISIPGSPTATPGPQLPRTGYNWSPSKPNELVDVFALGKSAVTTTPAAPVVSMTTGGGGTRGGGGSRGRVLGGEGFVSDRTARAFGQAMAKLSPGLKAQIEQAAEYYGIPTALAFAQIFSESSFKTTAQSPNNPGVGPAYGLTQQITGTASRMAGRPVSGEELKRNPELALTVWGKYMSFLFDRYGDWELATLAYHQGEGTVDKLVALLDKGKSGDSFFAGRPKGKAYLSKIRALAGLGGQSRYERRDSKGDPLGTIEQTGIKPLEDITLRDTSADEALARIYREMADALWELKEHTHLENVEREISLGLYKQYGPEVENAARQVAKLKDAEIERKKAQEEKKKADEDALDALRQYREEQERLFEDTASFFEDKIHTFMEGGFKGLWKSILDDMKQNFVRQMSMLLAQAFTPNFSGVPGGQGSGIGGFLGNIFGGMFGGRGMGPGGTPNFNPGAGGGFGNLFGFNPTFGGSGLPGMTPPFNPWGTSNQAGLSNGPLAMDAIAGTGLTGLGQAAGRSGGWKNILGKGGLFGAKGFGFNAGTFGGIGGLAMMAGSAIGGRAGNVLSMAGMGAQIGSMFGPWGGAIGAGVGAVIGLFKGGDDSIKRLKEAALSTYGINVKDKNVLKTLKRLGEGMFGKGKVGANAEAVVRSEEGQNILRAYAESSGQSSQQIDKLNYGDPNWEGNSFRSVSGGFVASGGSVMTGQGGYAVSSRAPSSFTPSVNGTIAPAAPNSSTTDARMMLEMMRTLDRVADVLDSFESMPPEHVVAKGAAGASRQLADAYDSELSNDARRNERLMRNQGFNL